MKKNPPNNQKNQKEDKNEFPFTLRSKDLSYLWKNLRFKSITPENRREIWLKVSGGEEQIKKFRADDIFSVKCEDLRDKKLFETSEDGGVKCQDCTISNEKNFNCCLNILDSSVDIDRNCGNPSCRKKVQNDKDILPSCCVHFTISKHISSLAISSDPFVSHLPLLLQISNIFTLVLEHHFQVYACLVGLMNNKTMEYLDKTVTKSGISSCILRYFLRKLVKAQLGSKIKHPWLKNLARLDPYVCTSDLSNQIENPWIFFDWQVILFQNLDSKSLIYLIDVFLISGVQIFYKTILLYFYFLFQDLNSFHLSDNLDFSIDYVKNLLCKVMRGNITQTMMSKAKSILDKVKVGSSKIKKLQKKFLNQVNKSTYNICRMQSIQDNGPDPAVEGNDKKWPRGLITANDWINLFSAFPRNVQLLIPDMLYSSDLHGWNLRTLYEKSEDFEPIVLIIKTSCNKVFGGFLTKALRNRRIGKTLESFGTGETFVFSLRPTFRVYRWVTIKDDFNISLDDISPTFMSEENLSHQEEKNSDKIIEEIAQKVENEIPRKKIFGKMSSLDLVQNSFDFTKLASLPDGLSSIGDENAAKNPNDIFVVANDDFLSIGAKYIII